ncbi:putative reverse transcriptase domain-containing protein [Tanacetum coccineum]
MSEARMREVIREQVAASMAEFMANMNRGAGGAGAGGAGVGGAGPAAPEITGWFEKLRICKSNHECKDRDKLMLALVCPRMVEPEQVKVEKYISGLSKNIHSDVTSSRLAVNLMIVSCKNKKRAGDCRKCGKCGKLGYKTAACWSLDRKDVTCFNCNEKGHRKRDCPKLKKNGQGEITVELFTSWEL